MARRLYDIGEDRLIIKIKKRFLKTGDDNIILGIGDDCAAVAIPNKKEIALFTTDSMVEGVHFLRELSDPYKLGIKSVVINISDIAAMGGIPKYFLLSLSFPEEISEEYVDNLLKGIKYASNKHKITLIGGNITKSNRDIIISITMYGVVRKGCMITRNGACIGDKIFVTGTLGDSSLGLKLIKGEMCYNNKRQISQALINRHYLPPARIHEGTELAKNRLASAMIDLSDGLVAGLLALCQENKVGAKIYLDRLPISIEAKTMADDLGLRVDDIILNSGEDYELLFTIPPANLNDVSKLKRTAFSNIGEIQKRKDGIIGLASNGNKVMLSCYVGYKHF